MYLSDREITFPLPPGMCVFVSSTNEAAPVLTEKDASSYWRDILNYSVLAPPPEGFTYVVVNDDYLYDIRQYPVLPNGEHYRVLGHRNVIVVPEWCKPLTYSDRGRYSGPSVRDCSNRCLYSDGCGSCNPQAWGTCFGGFCPPPDSYRVPLDRPDPEVCLCYMECARCGTPESPANLCYTLSGTRICDTCRRIDYTHCSHCSYEVLDTDYDEHEDDCREGCRDECCYNGSDDSSSLIHDYSYTPYLSFRGVADYYFGVELELSTEHSPDTGEVAEYISEAMGDLIYLKEDSSISTGMEVVTHPMSFDFARSVDWSVLDRLQAYYDVTASGECGLHIHVSKTAFESASHTYRWMRFIYRNAEPVQRLARREGSTYAAFEGQMNEWAIHYAAASKKNHHTMSPKETDWYSRTPGGLKRRRVDGLPKYTHRYAAINVENEQTFEMRFFASTVKPTELHAAIQFAYASVEYTRQLTAHKVVAQKGLDFGTFCAWLADNNTGEQFNDLISELDRLVG